MNQPTQYLKDEIDKIRAEVDQPSIDLANGKRHKITTFHHDGTTEICGFGDPAIFLSEVNDACENLKFSQAQWEKLEAELRSISENR